MQSKTLLKLSSDISFLQRVSTLLKRVSLTFMGAQMEFIVRWDEKSKLFLPKEQQSHLYYPEPRVFIQIIYTAPNTKGEDNEVWKGRKWYLSEHMTDDEIVKTAYLAFRTCVEHEVLESFKVDGAPIFNPHVDFEELIKISHKEIKRN